MSDSRRVAIVKSPGRADLFAVAVRELGYVPVLVSPYRYEAIDGAPDALSVALDLGPDWVAVTSPHAAAHLDDHAAALSGVRIAAVGPGTASALASVGLQPDFIGDGGGAALAAGLLDEGLGDGDLVIHPCADNARPELHARLEDAGVDVVAVPVYRMEIDEIGERSARGEFAAVVIGSPRLAARSMVLFPDRPRAVAIGRTTAAQMRDQGWTPAAVAERPTPEDVARALAAALA